jgi:hypothetical protein
MSIQLESGVSVYDPSQHSRCEFFGVTQVHGKYVGKKFVCGNIAFSNPYSANMFSFVWRHYSPEIAKATVLLFEQKMVESAPIAYLKFVQIDWSALFSKGAVALDWVGIVTEVAVALAGCAFVSLYQDSSVGEFNPYSPKEDVDVYVQYAIAYWAKHPSYGPAYKKLI